MKAERSVTSCRGRKTDCNQINYWMKKKTNKKNKVNLNYESFVTSIGKNFMHSLVRWKHAYFLGFFNFLNLVLSHVSNGRHHF